MGYDTLSSLLQSLPLTHVVLLQTLNPRRNLEPRPFWLDGREGPSPPPPALTFLQVPALGQSSGPAASDCISAPSSATPSSGHHLSSLPPSLPHLSPSFSQ